MIENKDKNLVYLSPFVTLLSGSLAGYSYWVYFFFLINELIYNNI